MRAPSLSLVAFACLFAAATASGQVATTVCKDGSPSAATGRGACADHGGVDKAATKQAKKAVKAERKAEVSSAKAAGTPVTCGDGSTSNPGRGACSHHGGVRVAAAANAPLPAPMPSRATTTAATPAPRSAPAARSNPASMAAAPAASPARAPAAASHRGEDNDPVGAIAQCNDGMYSHAANRRGACSRHKGVAKWM
jgi:hypothetical protein